MKIQQKITKIQKNTKKTKKTQKNEILQAETAATKKKRLQHSPCQFKKGPEAAATKKKRLQHFGFLADPTKTLKIN